MTWNRFAAFAALAILASTGAIAGAPRHARAAIMPTQLLPQPNDNAGPDSEEESEGDSDDDDEDSHGASRSQDLRDGVLRPPRTGDDEAVKVPPAEKLPATPRLRRE